MVALAKKQGKLGEMNIDFSELYDQEDDIYYVTFDTGEPSFAVEMNDILVFEVGIFTKLPTGFRILNFSKNKVAHIEYSASKIEKKFSPIQTNLKSRFRMRAKEIERSLEKVLAA